MLPALGGDHVWLQFSGQACVPLGIHEDFPRAWIVLTESILRPLSWPVWNVLAGQSSQLYISAILTLQKKNISLTHSADCVVPHCTDIARRPNKGATKNIEESLLKLKYYNSPSHHINRSIARKFLFLSTIFSKLALYVYFDQLLLITIAL